jgi:hypothetical protein
MGPSPTEVRRVKKGQSFVYQRSAQIRTDLEVRRDICQRPARMLAVLEASRGRMGQSLKMGQSLLVGCPTEAVGSGRSLRLLVSPTDLL